MHLFLVIGMYTLRVDCTPSLHSLVYNLTKEVSVFVHSGGQIIKAPDKLENRFFHSKILLRLWDLIVSPSTRKQLISLSIYFRDLQL